MNIENYLDSVLVERIVDNGDGTGTRFTWDTDGTPLVVDEPVTGLPIPEPPEPTIDDILEVLLEP